MISYYTRLFINKLTLLLTHGSMDLGTCKYYGSRPVYRNCNNIPG